jgi:hypothetical protein
MIKNFTFCVLAYNHSQFIVEHLETIKFQVLNYGKDIECSIIINDDASKDDTVRLVEIWFSENDKIFKHISKIYNKINVGTCNAVINISNKLKTKYFKITAGDDIYSSTNIFQFVNSNQNTSLLSGIPLRLVDGVVSISFFEVFNYLASDCIYKNKSLIDRLSNVSIVNAPNLFYSERDIKNPKIIAFLKKFDLVEDWPLQIAIAVNDKSSNLISSNTNIVLYRRTPGSAYLVASSRVEKDNIKVFDYLVDYYKNLNKPFDVIMLKNRRYLYRKKSSILKYLFDFKRIMYFFKVVYFMPIILKKYFSLQLNVKKEQLYYDKIRRQNEI